MSGGYFEYKQYQIDMIAEEVERVISKCERKEEYYDYSPEVIEKFKEGLRILKQGAIYVQRIDWLLSGDDGPENFLKHLKKDLSKLDE